MSINTVNVLGAPAPSTPSSAAPTFITADVLAALRQQPTQPAMLQQQVTPTAAPIEHPSMMQAPSNPDAAYGQALMQSALSGKPVGSTFEGVGRLAQLACGYYNAHKGRDEAKDFETKRSAAVHAQLNRIDPGLADASATSDADARKAVGETPRPIVF